MDHSLKAGTEISRGLSFCPVRLSSTSRCGSEQGILLLSHSAKSNRPSAIIWLFWATQLVIEEDAARLEPIILQEAA